LAVVTLGNTIKFQRLLPGHQDLLDVAGPIHHHALRSQSARQLDEPLRPQFRNLAKASYGKN
jgi:hypothetical protein